MLRTPSIAAAMLATTLAAALAQDPGPVSGRFDYTAEVFARVPAGRSVFVDASESEVCTGDIEGTSVAPFRMVISPDGALDVWIHAIFEGTVLEERNRT